MRNIYFSEHVLGAAEDVFPTLRLVKYFSVLAMLLIVFQPPHSIELLGKHGLFTVKLYINPSPTNIM